MKLIFWGVLFIAMNGYALTLKENFYSEHGYLNREQLFTSSIRAGVEMPITNWASPYFRLGSEVYDSMQYGYGAPGLKMSLGAFQLSSEFRVRRYYNQSTYPREKSDLRSVFSYSGFFVNESDLFMEPYSETVFTSADENNIIHTSYARLGYRQDWGNGFAIDVYFEPNLVLDKNGRDYNRKLELKSGSRALYALGGMQLSLNATLGYEIPNKEVPWCFKSLLVVGGEF